MFESIGDFLGKDRGDLSEKEVRGWVERWLRDRLGGGSVYCDQIKEGVALVRVTSGLYFQEVCLWEYDLCREVQKETGYSIRRLEFVW